MFLSYKSKHCQFLPNKNHKKIFTKILHNLNLKIYFGDKIQSLQKNVFTKKQFKEIAKKQSKRSTNQIFKQIFVIVSVTETSGLMSRLMLSSRITRTTGSTQRL